MFGFLARVLRVYRGYHLITATVLALMLAGQIVAMFRPALIGKMIDGLRAAVDAGVQDIGSFWPLVVLFVGTFPLAIGLRLAREELEIWKLDFEIKRAVQKWTLKRLFGFSPGQHTSENSGLKLSVVNKGQHALESLAFLIVYEGSTLVLETVVLSTAMLVTYA